jgi:hypothetical protein
MEVIRVKRPHHDPSKPLMNSQFHLHKHSEISSVENANTDTLGIKTVDLFPKNTAVGDVMFRELDNFKKSYDCGDILLVYIADIPYILESNPHYFYSFRRLKNQMRITIACGLDSRSRAGFWKNDRAAVCAVRTIEYNNLLF